ncbi:substrate-binding periplasmic protein [Massilia glaciei]|nr:transporter substrate-binding domain-containing protein [Massilia glaciei]
MQTIAAILILALLPTANALACTKTVRWFDDAPYSFRDSDGRIGGFDADLARAALARVGCKARFVELPWARALVELEAGRLDVLPSSFRSEQRERFAHFSAPTLQSPNVLYLGPGVAAKYRFARLEYLLGTNFRLGVQIGVSYGDKFDAIKANPRFKGNLSPITLRRNAWKIMALGRIDGLIADQASAELELRQLGLGEVLRPSRVVVSTNTAMFAFSKQSVSPHFLADFNNAIEGMIADGNYRKIRARYLRCTPDIKVLGCP